MCLGGLNTSKPKVFFLSLGIVNTTAFEQRQQDPTRHSMKSWLVNGDPYFMV